MPLTNDQFRELTKAQLTAEELQVLRLLMNIDPPEVAMALGVSRQYVHQVKRNAYDKIKRQGIVELPDPEDDF